MTVQINTDHNVEGSARVKAYMEDELGKALARFEKNRQFFAFKKRLSTIYGKRIIQFLQKQQVGETVRELGLIGQNEKAGTPTMGGLIIIFATLIPVMLFSKLHNIYIVLLIVTTLWMGTIGFVDDYIKIFKKDKEGLKGIFKVFGQVGLGLIVGSVLYLSPAVTVRQDTTRTNIFKAQTENATVQAPVEEKSTITTIPFFKNNEFDYAELLAWTGDGYQKWAWLVFIPVVIFIITAVSNGANLTDGIDGLAAGTSAISVFALGIFTFVSGNIISTDLEGYEFEITGTSDKSGFTSMKNVEGIGTKKVLLSYEKGMHQKPRKEGKIKYSNKITKKYLFYQILL
jgi:UDP-N-acetylmuramyl pentapeptide phosphotransferase/UDP-N-acetylglucosamine-1-phosphate transferase